MIPLEHLPVFNDLPNEILERLGSIARLHRVAAGTIVLRRGLRGRELWIVAGGGVEVDVDDGYPPQQLGPGAVLGEIALLTDSPTSATVRAERDCALWCFEGSELQEILRDCSQLRSVLMQLVLERRSTHLQRGARGSPQVVLLGLPQEETPGRLLAAKLATGLEQVVPRVTLAEFQSVGDSIDCIRAWRPEALAGEVLLLPVPGSDQDRLHGEVQVGDAILCFDDTQADDRTARILGWGLADHLLLRLVDGPPCGPLDRWACPVDPAELTGLVATRHLSWLVRWIARRQVGVALGAGAARGFAHLGVLAELEAQGLPIDRIVGSSMGGIAGLLYGLAGDGEGGIAHGAETLGRPGARRMNWWPRSSFLSDRELRRRAHAIARGRNIADLPLPVSVIATDLVRGERTIVDRGPVERAFFSTSAIPGALPPVMEGSTVLVDGAIVSRLPLDLIPRSRCAIRIAVNVVPAPGADFHPESEAARLRRRLSRFLGLRDAIGRSWELMGWQQGARDAAGADLLIEPRTHALGGYDFSKNWHAMVEAGRHAVREQAGELHALASTLSAPPRSFPPHSP